MTRFCVYGTREELQGKNARVVAVVRSEDDAFVIETAEKPFVARNENTQRAASSKIAGVS